MSEHIYGDQAWEGLLRLRAPPRREPSRGVRAHLRGAPQLYSSLTGITRGMTLEEVIADCDVRDLTGLPLREEGLPEARVLMDGQEIGQSLMRMRSPLEGHEFVVRQVAEGQASIDV